MSDDRTVADHAARLASRIEAFFAANPGEYLSYEDIALKFDCDIDKARFVVARVRKRNANIVTQTVVCVRPQE
jgi:DNA-directed RNA polymerase specialized sigma24 family protein